MKLHIDVGNQMMKGRRSMTGIRFWMLSVLASAFVFGAAAVTAQASGYQGAQAEAQADSGSDPYTFPNIKLCCDPPPKRHCCKKPPGTGGPVGHHNFVPVNCSVPTNRSSVGSMREAMALVGNGGTIQVMPGTACDVTGLLINKSVRIESGGYQYGGRAVFTGGDSCAAVNAAAGAEVLIRGFDIEACVALHSGRLALEENNIAWRRLGPAIDMRGGDLLVSKSTVRARETALYASHGISVALRDSRFATTADGRFVARLNVKRAEISDVLLKGARIGLHVDNVQDGIEVENFQIARTEPDDPYPPKDLGDQGLVIGDGNALNDLPWLSGMDSRRVRITTGSISGYRVGLVMGTSTRGDIDHVTVNGGDVGFDIRQGAFVNLIENAAVKIGNTGIMLESGARGTAERNRIHCTRGSCVCYGRECSSRSNYVFGGGLFRMSGTDCDD